MIQVQKFLHGEFEKKIFLKIKSKRKKFFCWFVDDDETGVDEGFNPKPVKNKKKPDYAILDGVDGFQPEFQRTKL